MQGLKFTLPWGGLATVGNTRATSGVRTRAWGQLPMLSLVLASGLLLMALLKDA